MAKSTVSEIKRPQAYLLRIELEAIKPPIWRQVWVEGQMSLIQLHHILQLAMGWTDAHLHEFSINGVTYATPHPEDDRERKIIDERRIKLQRVLKPDFAFEYVYDFGDHWRYLIRVEQVNAIKQPQGAAFVEAGARACPPEDCGGIFGYQEFLENLKTKPKGRAVKEFQRWAGGDFDPERFDRRAANAALLHMAWNHWGE